MVWRCPALLHRVALQKAETEAKDSLLQTGDTLMLDWNDAEEKTLEDDFLTQDGADGEAIQPAACPLNPDGLVGCDACQ